MAKNPTPSHIAGFDPTRRGGEIEQVATICARAEMAAMAPPRRGRPRSGSAQACEPFDGFYELWANRDVARARSCAEAQLGGELDANARIVLMNLYANGEGCPRDLDRAIHLACTFNLDESQADMRARILHLDALRREGWRGRDFDYCIHSRSPGATGGVCAYYERWARGWRRDAEIQRLSRIWTRAEKRALARLLEAKNGWTGAYADAHRFRASPAGWTWIGPEQEAEDAFLAQLRVVAGGAIPAPPAAEAERARQRLAAARRAAQRMPPDEWDDPGGPEFRRMEAAWTRYRDAMEALIGARGLALSPQAARDWLTIERFRFESGRDSSS